MEPGRASAAWPLVGRDAELQDIAIARGDAECRGIVVSAGAGVGKSRLAREAYVYWAEEGRASFDAVVCTCAFAGLVVVGTRPFGLDEPASIAGTAIAVTVVAGLAIVCFAKGRVLLGVVGLFVPVVALAGAARLGKPTSPWAHWRYDEARLRRSRDRFATDRPLARTRRRAADAIAGAPSERPD